MKSRAIDASNFPDSAALPFSRVNSPGALRRLFGYPGEYLPLLKRLKQ